MSKALTYRLYLRALTRWPADILRPECQFQDAVRRRIDRRFVDPTSTSTSSASTANPTSLGNPSTAAGAGAVLPPYDQKYEEGQVNALFGLLEGRYSRKYPFANDFLSPKSNPSYYRDLIQELEAAPTRSMWDRVVNKFKGYLRF